MDKKSKKIFVVLALVLSFFSVLTFNEKINAIEGCSDRSVYIDNKQIREDYNILKDTSIKLYDPSGNLINNPETTPIPNGSSFIAELNFILDNDLKACIESGDYYEFQINPANITFTGQLTQDLSFGEDILGQVVISEDGKVRLTFNEKIEEYDDVEGFFSIKGVIDLGTNGEPGDVIIKIPTKEETKIIIEIKSDIDTAISKKGKLDRATNPNKINWEVFVNQNYGNLKNAKVTDKIPAGLTYDNVEVYQKTCP